MGDVAASGGYYISMAADEIIVQPGTITGSIGVVVGKPVFEDLLGRAGITTDRVTEGAHGRMFAATHPFSDDEWSIVNSWLDQIYADFTTKVASGRNLSEAEVEAVARGRVWLGADAVHNGLADQLGGLAEAAVTARRRGGLPADAPLRIFPRANPLDQLRPHDSSEDRAASLPGGVLSGLAAVLSGGASSGSGSGVGGFGAAGGAGSAWGVAGQVAAQLTGSPAGELMMPGYWRIG
jgi:protease-4